MHSGTEHTWIVPPLQKPHICSYAGPCNGWHNALCGNRWKFVKFFKLQLGKKILREFGNPPSLKFGWTKYSFTVWFAFWCCVISFVLFDSYLQVQYFHFTNYNETSASSKEKCLTLSVQNLERVGKNCPSHNLWDSLVGWFSNASWRSCDVFNSLRTGMVATFITRGRMSMLF